MRDKESKDPRNQDKPAVEVNYNLTGDHFLLLESLYGISLTTANDNFLDERLMGIWEIEATEKLLKHGLIEKGHFPNDDSDSDNPVYYINEKGKKVWLDSLRF